MIRQSALHTPGKVGDCLNTRLLCRENEGDLHEGFNLGLDPSIADTLPSFQELKRQQAEKAITLDGKEKHDGLEHGENLWPSPEVWGGAVEFVSPSRLRRCA